MLERALCQSSTYVRNAALADFLETFLTHKRKLLKRFPGSTARAQMLKARSKSAAHLSHTHSMHDTMEASENDAAATIGRASGRGALVDGRVTEQSCNARREKMCASKPPTLVKKNLSKP